MWCAEQYGIADTSDHQDMELDELVQYYGVLMCHIFRIFEHLISEFLYHVTTNTTTCRQLF